MDKKEAEEKVHERTVRLSKEKKIPYSQALGEVLKGDPELAESYVFGERSESEKKITLSEIEDAEKEIDNQATQLCLRYSIEYGDAVKIVLKMPQNTEIAKRYIEKQ